MNIFQKYLADEFVEDYQEGRLSRRKALKLIASVTGSLAVANSLLAACAPAPTDAPTAAAAATAVPQASDTAPAEATPAASAPTQAAAEATPTEAAAQPTSAPVAGTVAPDDPAVQAGPVEFPGEAATLMGYLAQPSAGGGPYPVALVCHENRGLTEHIQDVTRRFAKAGYVGLAVDLLSREGGSASVSPDDVPGLLGNMPSEQFPQDFISGWTYLQSQPFAQVDRVGMVGFCFGGGVTWSVATHMPELKAAVPFYGPPPAVEEVPNINAAVLAIYGELDSRINGSIPTIEAAMLDNGKIYEKMIYANADHAFHNDTGQRYNAEAAQDAWARTLAWFGQYLA
jgi:carboxymethylenebutenolidase